MYADASIILFRVLLCEIRTKEFYSTASVAAVEEEQSGLWRAPPVEKVKKSVVTPNYYPHTRPPSNPPKTKQRGTI